MRNLLIAFIFIVLGQSLAFVQLQGQFMNEWMRKNMWVSVLLGIPISWLLIMFTRYCRDAFDGQIWPGRLIGFAIGAIVFSVMAHFVFNEEFTSKTLVCLTLAATILGIQLFWK
jgi:hypothetical protein